MSAGTIRFTILGEKGGFVWRDLGVLELQRLGVSSTFDAGFYAGDLLALILLGLSLGQLGAFSNHSLLAFCPYLL